MRVTHHSGWDSVSGESGELGSPGREGVIQISSHSIPRFTGNGVGFPPLIGRRESLKTQHGLFLWAMNLPVLTPTPA